MDVSRTSSKKEDEMAQKTNVVLVHGAWADGSSWSKGIPLLQQKGFNVIAAHIRIRV
jgi:pimeloyl-ACP methyl ester carboxylesterase